MISPDPRIEIVVSLAAQAPDGVGVSDLEPKFNPPVPRRTLQLWLADLVAQKRLKARRAARATRYYLAPTLAPVPGVATVASPGPSAPPTWPLPAPTQPAHGAVGAPVAASNEPSLPIPRPARSTAAPAPANVTLPAVSRLTLPAMPGVRPAPVPVEAAAPEPSDPEPENGYDPGFTGVFRKMLPHIVSSCGSRGAAEDDLILQGVRLFHDDSITIRTMTAQALAILDSLTEAEAAAWGVKPQHYQLWRKYWR